MMRRRICTVPKGHMPMSFAPTAAAVRRVTTDHSQTCTTTNERNVSVNACGSNGSGNSNSAGDGSSSAVETRRNGISALVPRTTGGLFGAIGGIVALSASALYYTKVHRPRALYQQRLLERQREQPPMRKSPLFVAGYEPLSEVAVEAARQSVKANRSSSPSRPPSSKGSEGVNVSSANALNETESRVAADSMESEGGLLSLAALPLSFHIATSRAAFHLSIAWRCLLLAIRSVPLTFTIALCLLKLQPIEKVYDGVVDLFEAMGPCFIKLGQWVATRPDAFPAALCDRLEALFDKAPPHPWDDTRRALLKSGVITHLCNVDPAPLNSGSVAQVHRAKLREDYILTGDAARDPGTRAAFGLPPLTIDQQRTKQNAKLNQTQLNSQSPLTMMTSEGDDAATAVLVPAGADVVVKVMHPGVRSKILADLWILQTTVAAVSLLIPGSKYVSLNKSVQEFSGMLLSQLDFEREADNMLHFRFNFRGSEHSSIVFPKPLHELSSKEILVETYEVGVPLSSQEAIEMNNGSGSLGRTAVRMFLKMIFEDNLIHADLHPGNMLLRYRRKDGSVYVKSELPAEDKASSHHHAHHHASHHDSSTADNSLIDHAKSAVLETLSSVFPSTMVHEATSSSALNTVSSVEERSTVGSSGVAGVVAGSSSTLSSATTAATATTATTTSMTVDQSNMSTKFDAASNGDVPEIVVLDTGLVTALQPNDRQNFVELFACVAAGDSARGAQLMLERSPEEACIDREKFIAEVAEIFEVVSPVKAGQAVGLRLSEIEMGPLFREVLGIMRRHEVSIDMNFATLVASIGIGEGVGRRLVPDFNLFEHALPFLLQCLRSEELRYLCDRLQEIYLTAPPI